jgi:hypothetical protein
MSGAENTIWPVLKGKIMKMVKICKRPYIAEDIDRWGQGIGTYSVYNTEVGEVEEPFWEELKLFETYGKTPQGKAELERAKEDLAWDRDISSLFYEAVEIGRKIERGEYASERNSDG